MEIKICSKCKTALPKTNDYYQVRKDSKDGYRGTCRVCLAQTKKQYRAAHLKEEAIANKNYRITHKDHIFKREKERRDTHKEKFAAQNKQYRETHIETIQLQRKHYRELNKEIIRERELQYEATHKKAISSWHRQYRELNKEAIDARIKQWGQLNKDKVCIIKQRRRARKAQLLATLTEDQWSQVKNHFNNICAYCGRKLKLTQDHFIPVIKNGVYSQSNIIPACRSCNSSKQDKDFKLWYPTYEYYSKEREKTILNYINHVRALEGPKNLIKNVPKFLVGKEVNNG